MARIRPFRGLRPRDELANDVIAPPYDVLSEAEARAIVASQPRSFLRVTRSEVDLPEGSDSHGAAAYAKARENLDRYIEEGILVRDDAPRHYLYQLTWQGHTQTGLMTLCATEDYDAGTIKRHELTRPDKEQDRVDHIQALDAQTGLVFLAYRDNPRIAAAMRQAAEAEPAWRVTTDDGVEHALTVVSEPDHVAALEEAFGALPALYVADGHHRTAAASRVAAARGGSGTSGWFLSGLFPDSELRVLAYNRLVLDLNGHTPKVLLAALEADFVVKKVDDPVPTERGSFTMYLDGQWRLLTARPGRIPEDDPVGAIDASVLQDRVLRPLLGIENPRTDNRVAFVGGIRGHAALSRAVDAGEAAVAFHLVPTGLDQLFAVADAGLLMPPKSTWFEPKLRGGVLVHSVIAR